MSDQPATVTEYTIDTITMFGWMPPVIALLFWMSSSVSTPAAIMFFLIFLSMFVILHAYDIKHQVKKGKVTYV